MVEIALAALIGSSAALSIIEIPRAPADTESAPLVMFGGASALGGPTDRDPSARDIAAFSSAPVLRWQRRIPGMRVVAASHTELSRPAAAEDSLYLGYASLDALVELDRTYGTVRHQYPAAGPVRSEALPVDDGVIFCDAAGYTWYYRDGQDEPDWSHFGGAPITSKPALHEGTLFVASVDDVVYALDAATGEFKWRYERPEDLTRQSELTLFGAPAPLVDGDTLLAGFSDGALVALSLDGGEPLWDRRVGEGRYPDLTAQPLVVDRDAYVSGFSEPLVSLDLETRNVRWRLDVGGAHPPVLDGDTLYHGATDGKLRAINRLTGSVLWTWDSATSGALTTPQHTEAGLIVTSSDGGMHLIDPDDGALLWSYEPLHMLNGIAAPPVIVGSQLYAVTNAGYVLFMMAPRDPASPAFEGPGADLPVGF